MSDLFAMACRNFAANLAELGIDPRRATIVLEPEDHWVLRDHAYASRDMDVARPTNDREIVIGDLTFLGWRRPAR